VWCKFKDGLDAFPIHIMQRALDWLCLQHFFLISSSKTAPEWVPVPDAYRVIAKLNLDDEPLDHYPGRLDVLPAERVCHLLTPDMEYFLKSLRGELKMPGVQLTLQVLELTSKRRFFGFPLPQPIRG